MLLFHGLFAGLAKCRLLICRVRGGFKKALEC